MNSKTIGQQFKEAREHKKVSLSEAGARTQIKISQLQALENDDFSSIPAPIYAKGFIKLYARYLGLDDKPLIDRYLEKVEIKPVEIEPAPPPLSSPPPPSSPPTPVVVDKPPEPDKEPEAYNEREFTFPTFSLSELIAKPISLIVLIVFCVILLLLAIVYGVSRHEEKVISFGNKLFEETKPTIIDPPEPYLEQKK